MRRLIAGLFGACGGGFVRRAELAAEDDFDATPASRAARPAESPAVPPILGRHRTPQGVAPRTFREADELRREIANESSGGLATDHAGRQGMWKEDLVPTSRGPYLAAVLAGGPVLAASPVTPVDVTEDHQQSVLRFVTMLLETDIERMVDLRSAGELHAPGSPEEPATFDWYGGLPVEGPGFSLQIESVDLSDAEGEFSGLFRKYRLQIVVGQVQRSVVVFRLTEDWPDQREPPPALLIAAARILENSHDRSLVCCRRGLGRTGTMAFYLRLLASLADGKSLSNLEVCRVFLGLNDEVIGAVQTEAQFDAAVLAARLCYAERACGPWFNGWVPEATDETGAVANATVAALACCPFGATMLRPSSLMVALGRTVVTLSVRTRDGVKEFRVDIDLQDPARPVFHLGDVPLPSWSIDDVIRRVESTLLGGLKLHPAPQVLMQESAALLSAWKTGTMAQFHRETTAALEQTIDCAVTLMPIRRPVVGTSSSTGSPHTAHLFDFEGLAPVVRGHDPRCPSCREPLVGVNEKAGREEYSRRYRAWHPIRRSVIPEAMERGLAVTAASMAEAQAMLAHERDTGRTGAIGVLRLSRSQPGALTMEYSHPSGQTGAVRLIQGPDLRIRACNRLHPRARPELIEPVELDAVSLEINFRYPKVRGVEPSHGFANLAELEAAWGIELLGCALEAPAAGTDGVEYINFLD